MSWLNSWMAALASSLSFLAACSWRKSRMASKSSAVTVDRVDGLGGRDGHMLSHFEEGDCERGDQKPCCGDPISRRPKRHCSRGSTEPAARTPSSIASSMNGERAVFGSAANDSALESRSESPCSGRARPPPASGQGSHVRARAQRRGAKRAQRDGIRAPLRARDRLSQTRNTATRRSAMHSALVAESSARDARIRRSAFRAGRVSASRSRAGLGRASLMGEEFVKGVTFDRFKVPVFRAHPDVSSVANLTPVLGLCCARSTPLRLALFLLVRGGDRRRAPVLQRFVCDPRERAPDEHCGRNRGR